MFYTLYSFLKEIITGIFRIILRQSRYHDFGMFLQTGLGANRYNHNEIVVKSTENVVEIKSQVC